MGARFSPLFHDIGVSSQRDNTSVGTYGWEEKVNSGTD